MSTRRAKSPSARVNNSNAHTGSSSSSAEKKAEVYKTKQLREYKRLFASIDVDGNGSIDANELYSVMHEAFPDAKFTGADCMSMLREADLNFDGELSLDEFVTIMTNAEGKAGNWAKLNKSLFAKGLRNLHDISNFARSALEPLRDFGRQHTHSEDKIASVGMIIGAEAVFSAIVEQIGRYAYHGIKFVHENGSIESGKAEELWQMFSLCYCLLVLAANLFFLFRSQTPGQALFGLTLTDSKSKSKASTIKASLYSIFRLLLLIKVAHELLVTTKLIDAPVEPNYSEIKNRISWFFWIQGTSDFIVLLLSSRTILGHLLDLDICVDVSTLKSSSQTRVGVEDAAKSSKKTHMR